MVQPHEVIVLEHWGGIPSALATMVKTTNAIAVTAKRLKVIFIFSLSIFDLSLARSAARRNTNCSPTMHRRLKGKIYCGITLKVCTLPSNAAPTAGNHRLRD